MGIPSFLTRKLFRRGSLREVARGRFAFTMHNPLATATVTGPPRFTINGIVYKGADVEASIDLGGLSDEAPWEFVKGSRIDLTFQGHLLRGGNRVHIEVPTREFGMIEIAIEDRQADFCDVPDSEE